MSVAFLSRPDRPPALAVPRLARIEPDRRPQVVIARALDGTELDVLRERLAVMGIDGDPARREARDPLVAIWVGSVAEASASVVATADLLLLGGGWPLLDAVLDRLEAVAGAERRERLMRLADLPGVHVPRIAGHGVRPAGVLAGGSPLCGP